MSQAFISCYVSVVSQVESEARVPPLNQLVRGSSPRSPTTLIVQFKILSSRERSERISWFLVRYPNKMALIQMAQSPEYQAIHDHREAGLEGQINLAVAKTGALASAPEEPKP